MAKILIKNGRIFDGENFIYADILTEDKLISKIETNIEEKTDFSFDAAGKTVLPGLIDIHTHLRGISANIYGMYASLCTLPFGVTACADASGVHGDKALLESFSVKALAFVCAEIKDDQAHFENALEMLEKFGDRAIGVKIYFDTENSDVKTIRPLREVVEFAETHCLRVMVHSSNSPVSMRELTDALRSGDILTHAYHGGVHNASNDGFECIKVAKARGVIIDAGLAGHIHTDFKIFGDAIGAGVQPDVISSDITKLSAYKRGGRYGLTMCMSIAKHLGMREIDIFRAVTSSAARALGKGNEWGRFTIGRPADIAVLEYGEEGFELTDKAGNRVYDKNGYRCVMTVADGEVLYVR